MLQDFCFHIHTPRCGHAENLTDREIAGMFLSKGFRSIAFTDHAPWNNLETFPGHKNWMLPEEKKGYLESIGKLSEEFSDRMEILSGFEMEYFPCWPDEMSLMRSESQIIVLGQHYCFNPDSGKYTRIHMPRFIPTDQDLEGYCFLIEEACRQGIADIVAHPDLFMLQIDIFGKKQEEISHRICEAALRAGIPIEINLTQIARNSFQKKIPVKYPCREFWEIASQYNARTLIGIDFHYTSQLEHYEETVAEARKMLGEGIWNRLDFCTREDVRV